MESREATLWAAGAPACAESSPETSTSVETEQIEHQGKVYRIDAALKGAFLMQADYTRKTQDLDDDRRAYAADRKALDSRIETLWSSLGDRILRVALNRTGPWGEDCPTSGLSNGVRQGAATPRQADASSLLSVGALGR